MKKTINVLLILVMGWMSAAAQNANPFISISTNPPVVPIPTGGGAGGNSVLQVQSGNAGNDVIVTNSMEITISLGPNAEFNIPQLLGGSDSRWTVFSVTPGAGGTIKLRNTGGASFNPFDLGLVNLSIRAVTAGGPATITGNIAYLIGPNAALGGAQSATQGNTSNTDDNSTTSLLASISLPVTLSDVSGTASSCNGIITWNTVTEANIDRFEIEYGKTILQFTTVGTVTAKNSPSGSTYKYVNNQGSGRGYYRLKMIDKDGTVQYSKIVSVDATCTGKKTITLYPNPLSSNESLTVIASGYEGAIKGELISMAGQVMRTYTLKNGTNTLPVEKLAQATYMLRVSDAAGDAESFRVVVIK